MYRLIIIISVIHLLSCTHKKVEEQKDNTQKQTQEYQPVTDDVDLQDMISELIINSPFDIQQKSQLDDLRDELEDKLEVNSTMNLKLRALLFKELLSPYYNEREIQVIATMIERNNIERNSLILDVIRVTNLITNRIEPQEEPDEDLQFDNVQLY